jgi:spore germination protein KA
MELAFELIREAGIRIPSVIGSTIGIVGALILGQAAVQANLVSPLLVILVSITGLGSFAVPNQDLAYAVRLGRFLFLILGSLLGFFGISLGVVFMLGHMVSLQSFGVPFLAPLYPHMSSNRDFIFRKQLWKQDEYGQFTRPKKLHRVRGAIRVWKNLWEDRSP